MYNQAALDQATCEIVWPGSYQVTPEHIRNALAFSGFSANQPLDANGRIAKFVRPILSEGLPGEREDFIRLLLANKSTLRANLAVRSHWLAAYRAEELYKTGKLADFCEKPGIRAEWIEQRDRLHALYHTKERSYGMSWKTLSFAQLLLWPWDAQVVPIDTHVLAWTHQPEKGSPQERTRYLEIEQLVIQARKDDNLEDLALGRYHWYRWSMQKDGQADSYASHSDLSPFI